MLPITFTSPYNLVQHNMAFDAPDCQCAEPLHKDNYSAAVPRYFFQFTVHFISIHL